MQLQKALAAPAPEEATDAQRKDYGGLVASDRAGLKDLERLVAEYDDHVDDWARTVKLHRWERHVNFNIFNDMVKALGDFEKDVPNMDRHRSRLLEALRDGDKGALAEFENMIVGRRRTLEALKTFELALKKSAARSERFEKKAAKDTQILANAKRGGGLSGIDDRHPVLAAQRTALERVAQKLEFFAVELDKLRDALS